MVAPDREMSGASHALTLNHPLRIDEVGARTYVVNGTPTDCVNLALNRLLATRRPDLVFSGINRGSNLGLDVTYSGTVSAAYEGALQGVPAIAASIEAAGDLERPAVGSALHRVIEHVLADGSRQLCVNVNLPASEIRGLRCAVQGGSGFRTEIIEKQDPRGRHYYWIGGQHLHDREEREDSDVAMVRAGWVSVTPLRLDLTDHTTYRRLCSTWFREESP